MTVNKRPLIITRKIRLFIDVLDSDKELLNQYYRRLYSWQNIVFKAANLVSSHLFIQEQVREFFYIQDDIKLRLLDRKVDKDGMLDVSQEGSLYRMISRKFKGELPSSIAATLSHQLFLTFSKEKLSYFKGERSLSSYKANIPVPISSKSIYNLVFNEEIKSFKFSLFESEKYKIPFRTYLGRDKSNNKEILQRCISGDYKICDSAYKMQNGKIYLILSLEIPRKEHDINPEKIAFVSLSFLAPLIVTYNDKIYQIGDKESYIYKRLAIQQGLRRRQQLMKFNNGGKGREKKTMNLERFKLKEKNFLQTFSHNLTSELVKFCIENCIGTLKLIDLKELVDEAKNFPFVLRNWSYGGIIDKIEYKCRMNGITLVNN